MRIVLMIFAVLAGMLTIGVAPAFAVSQAQRAYDTCIKSYNADFRFRGKYKAMVAGVGAVRTDCYWSWNAKSSGEAERRAMANCHKKYETCYLYADTGGLVSWSARISDMGGSDGSRENDQAAAAAIGGLISGFAGAIINSGGGSGHNGGGSSYHGGGSGSGNCPGATIAVDDNCHPLH